MPPLRVPLMHTAPSCERVAYRQEVTTSHCADMPTDGGLDDFSVGPSEDMAQTKRAHHQRSHKKTKKSNTIIIVSITSINGLRRVHNSMWGSNADSRELFQASCP